MQLQLVQKIKNNKRYIFLFPSYVFNFFSTSALLVIVYFSEFKYLAADLGLASSFLLFICHLLSLNERGVLLAERDLDKINEAFIFRMQSSLILIILATIFFSIQNIYSLFIFSISILIIFQWCFEIFLIKCEINNKYEYIKFNSLASIFYFLFSSILIFFGELYLFCIFTLIYNSILLIFCFFNFKNLKFFFNFLNYYKFFFKKNLFSNRLTSSFFLSISNFYFRYFIYILFPKELAASAFTFFTLGSFPASIYSLILAPSLVKDKFKLSELKPILFIYLLYLFLGIGIIYLYFNKIFISQNINYLISGFSMIGSLIMVYAFHKRQILIHDLKSRSLCFQIDIFYSLSVISIIPLIYALGNEKFLPIGFLLTSILAFIFYGIEFRLTRFKFLYLFSLIIFIPIFFILFDENYNFFPRLYFSTDPFFNSSFDFSTLPVPISFFIILLVFFLIIKNNLIEKEILYTLSLTVIFGLTSISILKYNLKSENIYVLLQFSFPLFAFIIGYEFAKFKSQHVKFYKILFYLYLFIISFQFIDILRSQNFILSSNLSSIGIYKHLQYVSQTIGIVFLISICFLIKYKFFNKLQLFILILIINIYLVFSTSISGLIYTIVLSLMIVFGIFQKTIKNNIIYIYLLIPFILISILRFQFDQQPSYMVETTYFKVVNFLPLLFERFNSMVYFIREISSLNDFLFGKNNLNELNQLYKSSFNYFVDIIYNLGVITFLPSLILFFIYLRKYLKYSKICKTDFIFFLCSTILIFLIVDTFIKSSLREIYTGSLIYFLWGFSYCLIKNK